MWIDLGYGADIHEAGWPEPVEAALAQDEIELVLQVNGKLRGKLRAPAAADKAALEALALGHEATIRLLEGRPPKKVIVVPGKLVNVVA